MPGFDPNAAADSIAPPKRETIWEHEKVREWISIWLTRRANGESLITYDWMRNAIVAGLKVEGIEADVPSTGGLRNIVTARGSSYFINREWTDG